MKKRGRIVISIVAVLLAIFTSWVAVLGFEDRGQPMIERAQDNQPHHFVARALFAASDTDMVGTSYADGKLFPIDGAHDVLSRVDVDSQQVQSSNETVSSSVTAWPSTLELSPDGQFAYVIESLGPAPAHVDQVKNVHRDFKEGRLLTTLDVSKSNSPTIIRQDDIAIDPTSIHVAPNGEWLIIAARDDESPITFVILDHGVPVEVRHPRLTLPTFPPLPREATEHESFAGVSFVRIAPNGHTIAVHIQGMYLIFGEVIFDANKRPAEIKLGSIMQPGKFISVGRWSLDSLHYVVSDTKWGPKPADSVTTQRGELISIAVDGLSGKVVSTATVSLSPEGMEINRTGDLFVTVNMERTYIPDSFPVNLIPRRDRASLSLVAFDQATGVLRTVDGPLAFKGVLPEDAVFDRDSNMIAVAIFNDRVPIPRDGWIELFAIDRSAGSPQLFPTGKRIRMPRGVHDLAVAY